jgi:hypothetical protein
MPEFSTKFANEMIYTHASEHGKYTPAERVLALQGIVHVVSQLENMPKNPFMVPTGLDTDDLVYLLESSEIELLTEKQKDQAKALWLRIMV